MSTRSFDTAGRLASESRPGPNGAMTTSYTYSPASRQVTVTLPNGGSRTQLYQPDGSVQQVTGSAVVPEYYTYAVETGGIRYARVNVGTLASSRLQESRSDWLGRTTQTSRPGFSGQPAFVEGALYENGTGRLQKTTRTVNGSPVFAPTRYEYDALSRVIRSGLDIDDNGLVLASIDRIADSDQYFENYDSAWWLTNVTKTYPTANNATALKVSTTRQRLTGFSGNIRAETVTIDVDGNTTTRAVAVNRPTKTATISTTTSGLSNIQTETHINGLPASITRFDGLIYDTDYDSLHRRSASIDPRTGTTTTRYRPNSPFVEWVRDAANHYVATYTYDSAGRVTAVSDAASKITRTEYNTLDQVVRRWGDAAHPVEFGYNSLGERTSMKTYRGGSGWNGTSWPGTTGTADTTLWNHDAPSGLLASKTDALSRSVTYTYNNRGQTATRTWARGVVATYGYESNTGELLTQSYSDGTPAVTYTCTRAGQLNTAADITGTRSFSYGTATGSHALQLDAINLPGFYNSRVLTRQYDGIKRPNGFNIGGEITQTHTYNGLGRFESLATVSSAQGSRSFSYTYNSGGLVSGYGVVSGAFGMSRGYEPNRDLLTAIDATWSGASRTRYDYTYNALSQRITAKQSGNVFTAADDFGGSTYYRYVYNDRGEVVEAVNYFGEDANSASSPQLTGRRFGLAYDNIGNRQSATRALGTSVSDIFQTNSANQYTSRENDVTYTAGTAQTASTIAVTGGTSTANIGRAGRYWGAEMTLNNTGAPVATNLTLTATLAGAGSGGVDLVRTENRMAYLAQALQSFTYDFDGNLTGDGVWNYAYDAENRLVQMTTTALAVSVGIPNRTLEFKYDYLGRRVQKRSLDQTAGTESYRRFLYDGWDLVAEFDAPGGTSIGNLLRSYTWGLDLAGSLTATGGVGALVQLTDHGTSTSYFPTYDGNGNVASLLRASDGVVVAKYEYSPFGELLRCEGTYAKSNPFRFSTKFTDDESGLTYYGARYFSPSLGRFLNRDPIEEAGGLNLYGFAGNDGANNYDYLGYSWFSKAFKSIGNFIKEYWKPIVAIVASVVTYGAASGWAAGWVAGTSLAGTATGSFVAGAMTGAASGFVGGAVGAALNGADLGGVLRGGLMGGAIGGLVGGFSQY
ncbi:MAG: RHS repeat-associated core domain-containing protein, partial [Opitutaceae bacterium]